MTKLKNWIWIGLVLVLSIGVSIILFKSAFFDISKFEELAPDFHYNAISMSAIIGGFLFTGISILISVIDKERIERLWNNSYLDNLYRSAFVGMIANIITIIVAFSLVFLDIPSKAEDIFVEIEIAALIIGVVFFAWCIKYLLLIISKLKTENKFEIVASPYCSHKSFKIRVDICSDFDYTIFNPNWRLNSMKQLGMRLRTLREGIGLSQSKFADVIGSTQSSINRYENGQATPTVELLRKYADYFDVSMDYIFARCDDPHGKLYEAKPPVDANNPELRKFVEMCFDPESPMNEKLKEAMLKMLGEAKI